MNYRIVGSSKAGFSSSITFSWLKNRRLIQVLSMAICALGILISVRLMQNVTAQPEFTQQVLNGTWELESINGAVIGDQSPSPVLSQRMSIRDGKVRGETVLRSNTEASTTAMPFPDESVSKVISNADETGIRVLWDGTYNLDDKQQLALHIGKAVYFVKVAWKPDSQSIEFNQDAILTIHGPSRYHRALSTPAGN